MKVSYSHLAVYVQDVGFVDVGAMLFAGHTVRWFPAPGQEAATSDISDAAAEATANSTSSAFWEYWLERGWGGLSSVTIERFMEAKDFEAAATRALEMIGKTQHTG